MKLCIRLAAASIITAALAASVWFGLAAGQNLGPVNAHLFDRLAGQHWYRVRIMGQPSGYAVYDTWVETRAGKPVLCQRQKLVFRLVLNNRRLEASSDTTAVYDEKLRPVRITALVNEMGREKAVEAEVRGDKLHVRVQAGGRTTEKDLPLPPDYGSDIIVAARAAAGQLREGQKFTISIFDPELVAFDTHEMHVVGWQQVPIRGRNMRLLLVEDKTKRLGLQLKTWLDENGVMWRYEAPQIMGLTLEKASREEALQEGAPLSLTNRVETDRALGDPKFVRHLVLRVKLSKPSQEPPLTSTARQKIAGGPQVWRVETWAQKPPAKRLPLPPTLETEDLLALTKPTALAQSTDPAITSKARQAAGDARDCYQAMQRIVSWVYSSLRKLASEPRPISALEVLDQMAGDCTEHALLAAAMGRALGIPTKMVVGMGWTGDGFYYHAWVKAFVGEWVEMDPTWGESLVDATHLQVAEDTLDELALARMSLATARVLGNISISVVEVGRR